MINLDDVTNTQLAYLIDEYIHSSRDREILKARLIDGIVFEALAEMFSLSTNQVKNIVYKGQVRIFKHIK